MPWVALAFSLALCLAFAATYYPFRRTFGCGKSTRNPDPLCYMHDEKGTKDYEGHKRSIEAVLAAPFESVFITSKDGLRLAAKYYEGDPGAPVVIFFHGYRSNAIHDGCGLYCIARELGYHVLMCDQRSHGESLGRALSFGVLEREDARLWAEYAAKRFADAPIFLSGISMGAATVLMAASLPLPKTVVGILADCPYSSPRDIITKVLADMKLPARLVYPLVRLGARLYGGFDPDAADAVSSVAQKTPPILIVHGLADGFVPAEMSMCIDAAASGEHRLVLVEGADHGKSYTVAPELYVSVFKEFCAACLDARQETK
ncbi:MAG: alpha/beta hydrolase [Ruminococcaceae bacterium]|nr:alpha/beta hydrolase [Oscillospiraceae bacterium]